MKKISAIIFMSALLLAPNAHAFLGLSCNPEQKDQYEGVDCAQCHGPAASWDTLCGAFDPAKAIRIEYESPRGCDEVSGTITIKATVQGSGAPAPASMKYELRTTPHGTPTVLTGAPPSYEARFDTTTVRNGFIALTAIPLDENGNKINISGPPYGAPGIIPPYRGFLVNNGLDVSRPLIVIGSPLHPYPGPFAGWTPEELKGNLTFALNLAEHLGGLGFLPEVCFTDATTLVLDPADPLNENPVTLVDLLGESVAGTPLANPGTACLTSPFFEIQKPNGLDDLIENLAWGNIKLFAELGVEELNATPQVIAFYDAIVDRLTYNYNHVGDWYSTFEYKEPVRGAEPVFRLKEKLKEIVAAQDITSVLMFGNYHRSTDFEMSGDAWPEFQEAVDEINEELGTSIQIGSITNNNHLLMDYEGFLRSQYLAAWNLVKTAKIPAGKKVGIISAGHGSSKTTRLYDISRFQNAVLKQKIEDYVNARIASIYAADTPFKVCYSEYANSPTDGLRGVGEQVWEWVNEGYDYILVYPMEWPWGTTETWEGLRNSAIELIDPKNSDIFKRDALQRSEIVLQGKTRLIIGESIFEQKPYNSAPYHYYLAANTQLLEDRMSELTGRTKPGTVSGTLTLTGGPVAVSLPFSDSLAAQGFKIALQNAGVRAAGISFGNFIWGMVNLEDMGNYIFALLAENSYAVEKVQVKRGTITAWQAGGSVNAAATATINGADTSLNLKITLQ
jgi:hypothetical protein